VHSVGQDRIVYIPLKWSKMPAQTDVRRSAAGMVFASTEHAIVQQSGVGLNVLPRTVSQQKHAQSLAVAEAYALTGLVPADGDTQDYHAKLSPRRNALTIVMVSSTVFVWTGSVTAVDRILARRARKLSVPTIAVGRGNVSMGHVHVRQDGVAPHAFAGRALLEEILC